MNGDRLDEIHPGEVLLEDFMKPLGITPHQLSAHTGLPLSDIRELLQGKRPITPDIANLLGAYFGMESRYWLNLQATYDARVGR
jgi:addiction module HigA family antidote